MLGEGLPTHGVVLPMHSVVLPAHGSVLPMHGIVLPIHGVVLLAPARAEGRQLPSSEAGFLAMVAAQLCPLQQKNVICVQQQWYWQG